MCETEVHFQTSAYIKVVKLGGEINTEAIRIEGTQINRVTWKPVWIWVKNVKNIFENLKFCLVWFRKCKARNVNNSYMRLYKQKYQSEANSYIQKKNIQIFIYFSISRFKLVSHNLLKLYQNTNHVQELCTKVLKLNNTRSRARQTMI